MSRLRFQSVAALAVGLLLLVADVGYAQTARSGGGASAQLLQQMQQLASERTSLQAENAKLKKDLEDLRKDRDALKNAQQALDRRAKSSEGSLKGSVAQREAAEKELGQTREKMQQLVAKFRETLQTLRSTETEQASAKQAAAARERELAVCVAHNQALIKLNQEVLTHFEHQSVWTRAAQSEPFTRIKRVQLENLVDDYKARADEQKFPAPVVGPAAAPRVPPAGAQNPPR